MKATAKAHPIQGLVKYHGMRDPSLRLPYHDSISLCTAPSETVTTVEFDDSRSEDMFIVDDEVVTGRGAERITRVVDHVRELGGIESRVRLESENSFPTNVGLGSSSSGFAAASMALVGATDLSLSLSEISRIARLGSSSAARSVTGGFSQLRAGANHEDCESKRIESPLGDELRIVIGLVPAYKETESAHAEAADSHLFRSRLAHIHAQISDMRDGLMRGDFEDVFSLAEMDSLSLAATTMTGPSGWVYWKPKTLEVFERVRELRSEGLPVYFSTDTGATVYVNTKKAYVDEVESAISACDVPTREWYLGGEAELIDRDLF